MMLGVSWTGGRPKVAALLLTLGSLVIFTGVVDRRLGVSTTGGRPKMALDLGFDGVGDAGVDVGLAATTCLVWRGGRS